MAHIMFLWVSPSLMVKTSIWGNVISIGDREICEKIERDVLNYVRSRKTSYVK